MSSITLACQVMFLRFKLGGTWQAPLLQSQGPKLCMKWSASFLHDDSNRGLDACLVSCWQLLDFSSSTSADLKLVLPRG